MDRQLVAAAVVFAVVLAGLVLIRRRRAAPEREHPINDQDIRDRLHANRTREHPIPIVPQSERPQGR